MFKYRYALQIANENNLGKGRVDTVFLSRLDGGLNKNWEAIPIALEFKANGERPEIGFIQIGERGYLHFLPRMRTMSKLGIALGANFAYSNPVISDIKPIKVKPLNFIKTLLDVGLKIISLKEQTSLTGQQKRDQTKLLEQELQEALTDIDYSIIRQNGSKDNSGYLKNFILGQAMGTESEFVAHAVFPTSNSDHSQDLSLFFVKEGKAVILKTRGPNDSFLDDCLHFFLESQLAKKMISNKASLLTGQNILVNDSDFFMMKVSVDKNSVPTLEGLESGVIKDFLENESRLTAPFHNDIQLSSKEIKSFKFIEDDNDLAFETIGQELDEFETAGLNVIQAENDFQALLQGGLASEMAVFTESSHMLGGRADLVILPLDLGSGTKRLRVVELKYAASKLAALKEQAKALEQVTNYKTNLKSFSDGSEVDLIALTYYPNSNPAESSILYEKIQDRIVHTSGKSGSERIPNSPVKNFDSGPLSPPYFVPDPRHAGKGGSSQPAVEVESTNEAKDRIEPWKSPNPGYAGDTESSPEKKSHASTLANVFGALAAGLGTLLAAAGATAVVSGVGTSGAAASGTGSLADTIRGIGQTLNNLQKRSGSQDEELVKEVETLLDEIQQTDISHRTIARYREKLIRQKEKVERLEKNYQARGKRVEEKISQKREQAQATKTRNKRKKELCDAQASRSKRDLQCNLPGITRSTELVPANSNVPSILTEISINKVLSFCQVVWGEDKPDSMESVNLECYETIDYQDKDSVFIDISCWDLANKTIHYEACRDELSLSFSLRDGCMKQLVLTNATQVDYTLIDSNVIIHRPIVHEVKENCLTTGPEIATTPKFKQETSSTPLRSLVTTERSIPIVSPSSLPSVYRSMPRELFKEVFIPIHQLQVMRHRKIMIERRTGERDPHYLDLNNFHNLMESEVMASLSSLRSNYSSIATEEWTRYENYFKKVVNKRIANLRVTQSDVTPISFNSSTPHIIDLNTLEPLIEDASFDIVGAPADAVFTLRFYHPGKSIQDITEELSSSLLTTSSDNPQFQCIILDYFKEEELLKREYKSGLSFYRLRINFNDHFTVVDASIIQSLPLFREVKLPFDRRSQSNFMSKPFAIIETYRELHQAARKLCYPELEITQNGHLTGQGKASEPLNFCYDLSSRQANSRTKRALKALPNESTRLGKSDEAKQKVRLSEKNFFNSIKPHHSSVLNGKKEYSQVEQLEGAQAHTQRPNYESNQVTMHELLIPFQYLIGTFGKFLGGKEPLNDLMTG